MIDGEELMRVVLKENVTALAVGIVDEQIKENNGFEEEFIFFGESEVMIVGIVVNELLERARAVRTVLAQDGERDNVKAEPLADDIRSNLTQGEGIGLIFVSDFNKEGVIRAKRKLTFDLKVAVLEYGLRLVGFCHRLQVDRFER